MASVPHLAQYPEAVQPPAEWLLRGQGGVPQPQRAHECCHPRFCRLRRTQAGQNVGQQDAQGAERRLQ